MGGALINKRDKKGVKEREGLQQRSRLRYYMMKPKH
jgi:hypothetical protein